MLLISLIFLLLSNAITSRRDKSILYSRATIGILLFSAFIAYDSLFITSIILFFSIFIVVFYFDKAHLSDEPLHLFNGPLLKSSFLGGKDKGKGRATDVTPPQSPETSDKSDTDSQFENDMYKAKRESLISHRNGESSSSGAAAGQYYDKETLNELSTLTILEYETRDAGNNFNKKKIELDNDNIPEDTKNEILEPLKQEYLYIKQNKNNLENKLTAKGVEWQSIVEENTYSSSEYSSASNYSDADYSSDDNKRPVKRVKFENDNEKNLFFVVPLHLRFLYVLSPFFSFLFIIINGFILFLVDSGILDNLFIDINIIKKVIFFYLCINSLILIHKYYRTILKMYYCCVNKDFFIIYANAYLTFIYLILYWSTAADIGVFYC